MYSVVRDGVDRTPPDGGALPAFTEIFVSLNLLQSTPKCPVLLVLDGCSGVLGVL